MIKNIFCGKFFMISYNFCLINMYKNCMNNTSFKKNGIDMVAMCMYMQVKTLILQYTSYIEFFVEMHY